MIIDVQSLQSRAQLPEDVAAASLAPIAHFSLACMFAQMPVDTFMLGVFLMQSFTYWKYQNGDQLWTKAIVVFTMLFAIGFTCYIWWFTGFLFVENFGKYAPFTGTEKLAPGPFLDAINSAVVQTFFTHRAYLLMRRNIWVPIVVGLLIATSVGATLSVLIIFSGVAAVSEAHKVFVPELLWLTSIMTADLILTVLIIYGLTRSKTGWVNTDRTIAKLIRLTFESQMPAALISLAFMISFIITPSSLLGAFLQGVQSKFYAIGLMYALNSRISFQQAAADTLTAGVFAMTNRGPTQIQVDVETYVQDSYPNGTYPTNEKKDLDSSSDLNNDKHLGYSSQSRLTEPAQNIVLN